MINSNGQQPMLRDVYVEFLIRSYQLKPHNGLFFSKTESNYRYRKKRMHRIQSQDKQSID